MNSESNLTFEHSEETSPESVTKIVPWSFKLFVAGETAASARAINNLRKLVAEHLPANTFVQIIDLTREPDAEGCDEVVAVPLLVRKSPPPPRRIIGDLENIERVLRTLEIRVLDDRLSSVKQRRRQSKSATVF